MSENTRTRYQTQKQQQTTRPASGFYTHVFLLLIAGLLSTGVVAHAQLPGQSDNGSGLRATDKPMQLKGVGIDEHLGAYIPKEARFCTSEGDTVTLGEMLKSGKPVVLNLAYFSCPMLCPMIMAGLTQTARKLEWSVGSDYDIWTVSFDPHDKRGTAAQEKEKYVKLLDRRGAAKGWTFMTGEQDQITKLTKAVGFKYNWLPKKKMFAHTAVLIFISPNGKVSRYLYGIQFKPLQMKNALSDAAGGKIGSTLDKIILYCCQYDPKSGTYITSALQVMKLSGVVVLIVLGTFLGFFWIREKKIKHKHHSVQQ